MIVIGLSWALLMLVPERAAARLANGPGQVSGWSRRGRPIAAIRVGDGSGPRVLVIGCVHGNETAGIGVARDIATDPAPPGAAIWVVPDLNPDGVALHSRGNADQVDLNRNFPYRWQASGHPGIWDYPGPRPLSEPESQFAYRLIRRLRPAITIWFHQPIGVVDLSGGSRAVEKRFSRLAGLPLRQLARYPGSAASWQNHIFPGTTSFVVELPDGALSRPAVERLEAAIVSIAPVSQRLPRGARG